MKKIGTEFELLKPGAEKSLIPIWVQVAEHLNQTNPNDNIIFWTTGLISSTLAVRITNAQKEEIGQKNMLVYSTPTIANAMKVLQQIHGDDFCDETLQPFRSVYENWMDYLILLSFNAPSVKKPFKAIVRSKRHFQIAATTVDEGLSGDVRVLSTVGDFTQPESPKSNIKRKKAN